MKVYTVKYRMWKHAPQGSIDVYATNKLDAWQQAQWVSIPYAEGGIPYSVWVESVTYSNGIVHTFNTFEGKAV